MPAGAFLLAAGLVVASCGGGGSSGTSATSATQGVATAATTTAATPAPSTPPTGPTVTIVAPQPGPIGPEGVPIPSGPVLGPLNSSVYPKTIDGIPCETSEQLVYHIHAHLTVFVDGQSRKVAEGIGIAPPIRVTTMPVGDFVTGGTCFYWLHTHANDGVVHIESPTQKLYTLGQFFDMWGQPLTTNQVGPATGTVTVFVNGQSSTGNPRDIALSAHMEVQIDVGAVVAPVRIDWSQTRL
jgi:hypothetical protein